MCEAALGEFVACVVERMRVYARMVPMMREIVAVARMRLQQWRVLNAASSFYLNLNVVNSSSMRVHYGPGAQQTQYRYGSAGMGLNWETPSGVQSAQLGQQAASPVAAEMSDTGKVRALGRAWKEVE